MRIITILLLAFMTSTVSAETIWCKMFNAGCLTAAQKYEQIKYCEKDSNYSYFEALEEATVDPSIWKFDGAESAQDYAEMRKSLTMEICLKYTN